MANDNDNDSEEYTEIKEDVKVIELLFNPKTTSYILNYFFGIQTRKKRRKLVSGRALSTEAEEKQSLSRAFFDELGNGDPSVLSFQDIIDQTLPHLLQTRLDLQEGMIEIGRDGGNLRPPTRAEVSSLISGLAKRDESASVMTAITERKLKLNRERRRALVPTPKVQAPTSVEPLTASRTSVSPNPDVIDALYNIQTTPFALSFLSRLQGTRAPIPPSAIAVDWETITPWMSLMSDIRDHYVLSQ
ncbi:hypothetical protein H0H87_002626 [Tephrocybe sp. NHM501043]|nr:hypothetical protein H0H87_002626 [Tephrocybe sp. NHM501043]